MKNGYRCLAAGTLAVLLGALTAGYPHAMANGNAVPARIATSVLPAGTGDSLYQVGWAYDLRHPGNQLLINNGITYMAIKELSVVFSDYIWTTDHRGVLTVTAPNHKLTWGPGTKTAYTNAGKLAMAAAPIKKDGQWFYPLKSIAAWAGGEVKLTPTKELIVNYAPLSILAGDPQGWYWVRRDNGIVYTAIGSELPRTIGWSNARAAMYYGMTVTKLGESGSVLLTVNHTYGEPSLGTDIYKLVIQNGKLTLQTKASYYGMRSTKSIETSEEGYHVLVNGTAVLFLNEDAKVVKKFGTESVIGTNANFTVEYASIKDGIALIRPYASGMLLFVDLAKETSVTLYKELLSAEEQQILEGWNPADIDYPTDRIEFVKREGNVFTFEHQVFFEAEKLTLTYTWERV
jgi:hypothetical protein